MKKNNNIKNKEKNKKIYYKYTEEEINKMLINVEKELSKPKLNEQIQINYDETDDLWVNKYQPKTFIDLISDDKGNRLILQWLKKWDGCVYNKVF